MKTTKKDTQQYLFGDNIHYENVPSLIKWTGSKRSQVKHLIKLIPEYNRYIEPFLGGGSMLYLLAKPNSLASDLYEPLIKFWKIVKANPLSLIADYEEKWNKLDKELNSYNSNTLPIDKKIPETFYSIRDSFNETKNPYDLNFIMRTCVNGIVRFNNKGFFNNSFHLSRRGMHPKRFKLIVESWHDRIRNVEFVTQDYTEAVKEAGSSDFIYFDPPYTSNKQRYIADLDVDIFFNTLEQLNSKGVKWGLSFDGIRGQTNLIHNVPKEIYKNHYLIHSGKSAVHKVLNGHVEDVAESFYTNF